MVKKKPQLNVWKSHGAASARMGNSFDEMIASAIEKLGNPTRQQRDDMIRGWNAGQISEYVVKIQLLSDYFESDQQSQLADALQDLVARFEAKK